MASVIEPRALPNVRGRRRIAGIAAAVLLIVLGAAGDIARHYYRAMHSLLEAEPPAAILASLQQTDIADIAAVSFVSSDGLRLAAWYVPPRNGAAVIVTHGTNGDRSMMLAELRLLTAAGFGILAFDWPGLGQSEGVIRWDGQARHALLAAIDWLAARPEVDATRIGSLGFSIGGFVLTQVAAEDPRIRAVVLEASPPSFKDYLDAHDRRWGPLSEWAGWLALRHSGLLDPAFQPKGVIARIAPRPLLILGGTQDTEVPRPLVSKLYEAARGPKSLWIVEGAGHGNYSSVAGADYAQRLTGFFRTNLGVD